MQSTADYKLSILIDELQSKGYKNKSYTSQKGNQIIGSEFNLQQIYRVLNNPLYNGKMKHKKEVYDGEHEAIIDDVLWNKVQNKIAKKEFIKHPNKSAERPKLVGKIFDYHGNRLGPTYSYKYSASGRYKMRYYINREISKKGKTPSEFKRIRAEMIDEMVAAEISALLTTLIRGVSASSNNELVTTTLKHLQCFASEPIEFLSKITLYPKHMQMTLSIDSELSPTSQNEVAEILNTHHAKVKASPISETLIILDISAKYKRSGGQLFITTENGKQIESSINAEYQYPDDKTFTFIAKSFYWNKQIENGAYKTPTEISKLENQNIKYVKRAMRQRFLSPQIIEKITSNESDVSGKALGVESLSNVSHWCWGKQEQALLK